MIVKHKESTKNNSKAHSSAMLQKSKTLRNLQTLVKEMRDLMFDHAQEEAQRAKAFTKTIKAKSTAIATLTKRSERKKNEMIEWKIKFNALKDDLVGTSVDVDALSEEIEEWKEYAEEMRESYEESIHLLTPRAIEKSWIKNLNKKGKIVTLFLLCCVLTHTNTLLCQSIFVTGGHMEWNTNSNKLILNWLANRTPPSCI